MSDERPKRGTAVLALIERFDDLFTEKAYAVVALGLLLAWVWMGLTEGYPIFMDGIVDMPSVALLLLSLAVSLLVFGFVRQLDALLAKPGFWVGAAACVSTVCLLLLGVFCGIVPLPEAARLPLVRCAMVPMGLGTGVLVHCLAAAFANLRPASMAVGFFLACGVMFPVYFSLDTCKNVGGPLVEGVPFCLLPLAAALLFVAARASIVERLALWPEEPCSFASGYVWMCVSFGVFFFAMAAKAALEPAHEFATGSDTSVVAILVIAAIFLYLIALRSNPTGVFKLLKTVYSVSVLVLTMCLALQRLSLDPIMSIIFNADCVLIIMVLLLLTIFVAHANEAYVCKVVGIALAAASVGMMAGWVTGVLIFEQFGHDRVYFSIAFACATAVFSTMGFSSRSFPHLTNHGEGAKKLQRNKKAAGLVDVNYNKLLADSVGLSEREYEVFELLAAGYNAVSVSERLQVSYHTGRTHVRNVYKKLDVHSHAELLDACQRFRAEQDAHNLAE